jgi:ATP-dependent RNA helicase DeaD
VPIYGGASYDRQLFELKKGVQIVIGTPGRIIDHLERGTLKLDQLKVAILDEADRMLDMGFRDDIQKILDATPDERQTVFFSATLSGPIKQLISRYSREAKTVAIERKDVAAPDIEQFFYEIPPRGKTQSLIRLVDFYGFRLGIIFCNTQRMVDELADALLAQGFSADRLHGGITQAQRTRVMNKFKNSEFEFLVATDVAARGIDVDALEVVINYDLPHDPEDYVHRIGRTGRAGKKGMAATFVTGRDIYKIQYLEKFTHSRIRRANIPTPSEVEGKRSEQMFGKVQALLTSGKFADQTQFTDRLMEEGFQATEVCSALFSLLLGQASVEESFSAPKVPGKSEFPNELPDHEGFAQAKGAKGFKKGNFQQREPGVVSHHSAHGPVGAGPKPGFKSAFKPSFKAPFEKGKPGKFVKGFKKERAPR